MAFDKSEPADTTKIRNLGVVIRPNWDAIEVADSTFRPYAVNFQNRTPLGASNDPATIADTSIIYVKDDGAGNPELYSKDGSGNIIQMSEDGRMGGPSTNVKMNNFRFGSATVDYSRNNVMGAALRWNSAGATLSSFGCTMSKVGSGRYRVTLNTARANSNYWPVANSQDEGNSRVCKINNISTTQFDVHIVNKDGSSRDAGGYCVVFGGF